MPSPLRFSFAEKLPKTRRALAFARSRHGDQHRTGDGAMFLVHPAEVAALLARSGYPDDVVAAAVLHDVLENTDVELTDLRSRFGSRVAALVAVVSDDPTIVDEDERKTEARERVRRYGGDALAVYAADKVSKVRELRLLMVTGLPGDEAKVKLDRYQASLAMLKRELSDIQLVELLRFEVEALEQLPPLAAPPQRLQAPAGADLARQLVASEPRIAPLTGRQRSVAAVDLV
jgi:HD domain